MSPHRRPLLALALTGAVVLVVPAAASAARCPVGTAVPAAEPRPLAPAASALADRRVLARQTDGGRVVLCRSVGTPARARYRLVAELGRVGSRDDVVLYATQGTRRVAWWVDRPGSADRIRERAIGRRATRERSVPARLTRPRTGTAQDRRPFTETRLAVGLDGTVAWVHRDGARRELRRARPGRAVGTALRWTVDTEAGAAPESLVRWGSRALVVGGAGGDRVVALDAGAGRCGARRVLRTSGASVGLSPEPTGAADGVGTFAERRLALCDARGRVRVAPVGSSRDEGGDTGSSAYRSEGRARRAVLLGGHLLVEASTTGENTGFVPWRTDVVAPDGARIRGPVGWIQRTGEAPPGPAYPGSAPVPSVPGTDPADDDRLVLGDGVAAWRTSTYRGPDALHVLDAGGHRVVATAARDEAAPNAFTGLRIEGTTVRFRERGVEREVTARPAPDVADTGRRDPLVPVPSRP